MNLLRKFWLKFIYKNLTGNCKLVVTNFKMTKISQINFLLFVFVCSCSRLSPWSDTDGKTRLRRTWTTSAAKTGESGSPFPAATSATEPPASAWFRPLSSSCKKATGEPWLFLHLKLDGKWSFYLLMHFELFWRMFW